MRLWDWALEAYARQDVADACLHLQDAHGQNVPYLLWAAWAAGEGRAADLKGRRLDEVLGQGRRRAPARRAARAEARTARRRRRRAKEALRDAIKSVELKGERVLMESLEALSGPAGPPIAILDGLKSAAAASGDPPRTSALERLAKALS
jgi:uncharacterized protein (TIGR02444 family)